MTERKGEASLPALDVSDARLNPEDPKMKGIVSQNGWGVILDEDLLRTWVIPGSDRTYRFRPGPAGFVMAWFASWFNDKVEALDPGVDDWGWSPRKIDGSDEWSNHASATAEDNNADRHPQGHRGTFSDAKAARIRAKLEDLGGCIKWGGDFQTTVDEMHFEIQVGFDEIAALAKRLRGTGRGRRLAAAN